MNYMAKGTLNIVFALILVVSFVACENHEKILPISEIFINMPDDGYEVEINDTIYLSPKVTYDINSSYMWEQDGEIISTEKNMQLIPTTLKKHEFKFTVTNERGSDDTSIIVQSMYLTDLEEFTFEEKQDTFWTNALQESFLVSGKVKFNVSGGYSSDSWTGFTYSNMLGNNSNDDFEKFSCYKSATEFESSVHGILLLDEYQKPITLETLDGENHLFKSISINNTYYLYDAISNEKYGSKKFGGESGLDPDFLTLTITGFNKNNTQRGTVEVPLADLTPSNNRDDYILSEWITIDLQPIGAVNRLEFVLVSSDSEAGKINTPAFVCFDEIKIIE